MIGDLADMQQRAATSSASIDFLASGRKTKKLLTAEAINKELGGKALFRDLSFALTPGMRLGLVGPNGSGKTTLLRIVAGETTPDRGTVERADGLRVVYFDQNRAQLDPTLSLKDAFAPTATP
ncbi:MAG: ATP-binding cassette domain-containing protein [Bryobacteraceae bacterium]